MAKKKRNNDFFAGLWKAMGNYAGLKLAAFLFVLFGGGGTVMLKSCNDNSTAPAENQHQTEAQMATQGRG